MTDQKDPTNAYPGICEWDLDNSPNYRHRAINQDELAELANDMVEQDNRMTSHPVFFVTEKTLSIKAQDLGNIFLTRKSGTSFSQGKKPRSFSNEKNTTTKTPLFDWYPPKAR